MRRNFAQVLKAGKINLKKEYSKLYSLFYGKDDRDGWSLSDMISMNFECFYFRGTCLDLDEFDKVYGFHFVEQPQDFDIDYLVSFCEYIYNFVLHFDDSFFFTPLNKSFYLQHINKVIESIGYIRSEEDGFTIFVPQDNVAMEVAQSAQIPQNLSYKVISYNHHSMKRDLESKRHTLLIFADLLEAKREALKELDRTFASDLFYAFNNFNIRHNNIDPAGAKYKQSLAALTSEQLEQYYDMVYQMCLLAFMRLDYKSQKKNFDAIKSQIERA